MKKRFSLVLAGVVLSMLLIFTGCGEGKGAEDTGPDGMVGDRNTTSNNTTTTTTDNNLMDDAERFAEDIMPGGGASSVR